MEPFGYLVFSPCYPQMCGQGITRFQCLKPCATSTIENIIDYATANYMILFGGILIAIFSGWLFKDGWAESEFDGVPPILYKTWLWLARIVAPVAVTIALYTALTS